MPLEFFISYYVLRVPSYCCLTLVAGLQLARVPNYFPTNLLKLVLDIRNRCPKHGLSQILAEFCKLLGVVVMSDGLSHCPRPFLGVVALEDSWTNKDTIHPKLHQQCHICRRSYKQQSRVRYSLGFNNHVKAVSVVMKIIKSQAPHWHHIHQHWRDIR